MNEHAARVIRDDPSLAPVTHLCVSDVTDGHAVAGFRDGRALAADGRELLLLVVSPGFAARSPLARQRLVNGLLDAELRSGRLHSVRMRCLTPAQWEARGRPRAFRTHEPCAMADAAEEEGRDRGGGERLQPAATPSTMLVPPSPPAAVARGVRKISIDGEGEATTCACGEGSL